MWPAYWARSASRTARLIESWAPTSVRTLRRSTRTGSRPSFRTRWNQRSNVDTPKRTGNPVIGSRQQLANHGEAHIGPALVVGSMIGFLHGTHSLPFGEGAP